MTARPPITSQEYDALRESLADSGASFSLPELHGGVSGALCSGGPAAAERWAEEFLADHEATDLPRVRDAVRELVRATWQTLSGGELAFEPLLPNEDDPLDGQVQALALWCHGFLSGFAASAPDLARERPKRSAGRREAAGGEVPTAELAEILADFGEISRAGIDEEDEADRDTADFALAELKEYARVSTQIVFESLAERRGVAARDVH